jgi:hypothetical protein
MEIFFLTNVISLRYRIDVRQGAKRDAPKIWMVLTTAFAGAMLIGFHSTTRWMCAMHQQFHVTVPEWAARLIVGNAIVVCRWFR